MKGEQIMISYEEFVKEVREELMERLQFSAERVYIQRKGGIGAQNGDKLFIKYADEEDANDICGFNIEELYAENPCREAIQKLVEEMAEEIEHVKKAGFMERCRKLKSFEEAKSYLSVRAISYDRNKDDLETGIYKQVGDIALTVYLELGEDRGSTVGMKIRKSYVEDWNKTEEEVFQAALKNTAKQSAPRIYRWEKLLFDINYRGDEFMDEMKEGVIDKGPLGNCLSTTIRSNGAVAVFLPGVAERLSELLEGDFYAVFTSVHEVMIHSVAESNEMDLKATLLDTLEEATPEADVLTKKVYRYDKESKDFVCCN